MKINEVEALVGITRKNIRFYEAEGLLSPRRNSQNGYRDYGETEVEVLRRIKLLRKLGLPLEEIRQMQHGAYTVGDGMRRHLVSLERERQNLEAAIRFCGTLTDRRERLEELENRRDELENRLACEKLAKPKVSAEFMTFWLHRFRKLDVRQQSHRKMLIDTFINAIFLYDDKMVITFNYKEGTKAITFAELQEAISNKNGSDLDCIVAPRQKEQTPFRFRLAAKTALC